MPRNLHRRPRLLATRNERARRVGYSLVEVVAAIALMAATLAPAMSYVHYGMKRSVEDDRRQLLALYAASQIEERLGFVASSWTEGTLSGDYSADGHPGIRYTTTCSDEAASGGIANSLMDIRSTVYYDTNADGVLSAGEMSCTFRTKIGRFATYQALSL